MCVPGRTICLITNDNSCLLLSRGSHYQPLERDREFVKSLYFSIKTQTLVYGLLLGNILGLEFISMISVGWVSFEIIIIIHLKEWDIKGKEKHKRLGFT